MKWGSKRIDGPERIVSFQILPVPGYLDGGKVRRSFRKLSRWFSSLPEMAKKDLADFFETNNGQLTLGFAALVIFGSLFLAAVTTILFFVYSFIKLASHYSHPG